MGIISDSAYKPKPPIRQRKKKFFTTDDLKQQQSRQSEFVELSTSDIVVDSSSPSGEVHVLPNVAGVLLSPAGVGLKEPDSRAATALPGVPEEGEEEGEQGEDQDNPESGRTEVDLEREEWEVIPDSAAENVDVLEEPCIQPNG
jgi:hypothetical protein